MARAQITNTTQYNARQGVSITCIIQEPSTQYEHVYAHIHMYMYCIPIVVFQCGHIHDLVLKVFIAPVLPLNTHTHTYTNNVFIAWLRSGLFDPRAICCVPSCVVHIYTPNPSKGCYNKYVYTRIEKYAHVLYSVMQDMYVQYTLYVVYVFSSINLVGNTEGCLRNLHINESIDMRCSLLQKTRKVACIHMSYYM